MSDIFIFRGVEFELGYTDYNASNEITGVSNKLNERKYTLSAEEFSYRIINHWEKNDLLTNVRESGKGWRKYSLMDKLWLYIVREMRNFGISLDMIHKVKMSITIKSRNKVSFPLLEYYISLAIAGKPVYLLIFENGQASPVIEKEYQANREFSSSQNFMQINLNNLVQKLFPERVVKAKKKEFAEPNLNERKGIQVLRLNFVKKVMLTDEKGQKQSFSVKNVADSEEVAEKIFQRKYRHIELQLNNQQLLSFSNENMLPL